MMGNKLEIEFSGIPEGASLTAEVTGILIGTDPDGRTCQKTGSYDRQH